MSLQTAFYAARSALLVNAAQTSTVSRNVAGVNEAGYARRMLLVESNGYVVQGAGVDRSSDLALREAMLSATSAASATGAVDSALAGLQQSVGGAQSTQAPSVLIGALQSALTQAASAPQDSATLASAVDAAKTLASSLNSATSQVESTRRQADSDMVQSVATINSLLTKFDGVNSQIVAGRQAGADTSDAEDQRDAILSSLAQQIGIKTVVNQNGGTAIYTDNGATLFQDGPRKVAMDATPNLAPGASGKAVYVDGAAITGPSASTALAGGALAGLATVRDTDAPTYQAQLDEVARGLIDAFAQTDQSGGSASTRTGLFTWSGAPSLPVAATSGLAGEIAMDATVDPTAGGNAILLRDGGIGAGASATYTYNTTGAASYTGRLTGLSDAIVTAQSFDPKAQIATNVGVSDFATGSLAWLEATRKDASDASDQSSALASQATTALSNATGVNIDDQMSQMLDLENSYQASAKMMASVDTMYNALFSSMTVTQ